MQYSRYSVRDLVKLEKRRFRDEEGVILIEGKKIFEEAVTAGLEVIQILVTEKFLQQQTDFVREQKLHQFAMMHLSEANMLRLAGTKTPQGLMAVVQKPVADLHKIAESQVIVACDNIRDPGNLGTIFRTADWFGVQSILVSSEGTDPYNDKVIRATMGSLFHLNIYTSDSFVSDCLALKDKGFKIVVSRPEVNENFVPSASSKMCLVLGNESEGTSPEIDEIADANYSIKRYGKAESLNVAVSFGIMMNELVQKISL
jgi:RNA methyltransferase, TrmH family